MASSKILPGCLVSLAAVAVFYMSWVSLPSVQSEAEVKKLLERQQQAFEEDQKLARDPAQNAFIDPQFSPYWGRKSIEYKARSTAADAVSGLRAFGFLGADTEEHGQIAALWKSQDPALRAAVADFAALHPSLSQALRRPHFILPSAEGPDFDSEAANFLAQRAIAQALSAYAEVQLADGKPAQALDTSLEILALARLVVAQKGHSLISTMVASALQATGQETLGFVLQSSPHWSRGELQKTLSALQLSPIGSELGLESFEYELWVARNSFQKKPADPGGIAYLTRLPGVWQREWRLYQNDHFRALQDVRAQRPANTAWMGQFSLMNWFLGQHSWMSAVMMPNFERVTRLLTVSRQRQDFLHLYVQLLLDKSQGRLPQELVPERLGQLDPKRLSYRIEKGEPRLAYDLDSMLAQSLPQARRNRPGSSRWETLMQAHWALPVAP